MRIRCKRHEGFLPVEDIAVVLFLRDCPECLRIKIIIVLNQGAGEGLPGSSGDGWQILFHQRYSPPRYPMLPRRRSLIVLSRKRTDTGISTQIVPSNSLTAFLQLAAPEMTPVTSR